MKEKVLRYVNFKIYTKERNQKLASLAFFHGKSIQETLEEALDKYFEDCVKADSRLLKAKEFIEEIE